MSAARPIVLANAAQAAIGIALVLAVVLGAAVVWRGDNAPSAGVPLIVADPRPGDLRTDPDADTLPADYQPAPPARTITDAAYGPDPAQLLDVHFPGGSDAATPVVLFLHSGGWIGGDKAGVPDMVMRFVERGYVVASANYRLAPEHPFPSAVEDVHRAIQWLRAHGAAEATLDGDRIVVVGASAGGYLAAFATATGDRFLPADLTDPGPAVVGVVSFVGPTDLVQQYVQPHEWSRGLVSAFVGCDPCREQQLTEASVGPYLHRDLPPAYWAYGGEDRLVDADHQGRVIAHAWAGQAGSRTSWLDIVDDGGHDLDESMVNLRALDTFVDEVTSAGAP